MVWCNSMNSDRKYVEGHAPKLADFFLTRRQFLQRAGMGFGALGLATLLAEDCPGAAPVQDAEPLSALAPRSPHFPAKAKHVVHIFAQGAPSHEDATVFMNTGSLRLARPSLGSWLLYGLGTENQNMPGYISLRPGGIPAGGSANWQAAFLPGVYQGMSINTQVGSVDRIIENIRSQYTVLPEQRRQLDLVHKLNELHSQNLQKDAQLEARLQAYEMAFKMQTEATDAFDINKEPQSMRELYGRGTQGNQLLIARRLIERGVRFIQVWAGGWDHHQDIEDRLPERAREIDQPLAAFIADLKQRNLFESTLVVWGGEFGRK